MAKAVLSGETNESISKSKRYRQGYEVPSVARLGLDDSMLLVDFVQSPDTRLPQPRQNQPVGITHRSDLPARVLDPFSTSQTKWEKCAKNVPCICIPPNGKPGKIMQACCNDWTCPRCGKMRARYEYGRMVIGARALAAIHDLFFLTLT